LLTTLRRDGNAVQRRMMRIIGDRSNILNQEEAIAMKPRFAQLFAMLIWLLASLAGAQDHDSLPSWNDRAAKQAILKFVRTTTDPSSPNFVPPEQRIATFDQDGTTWVEQPMYTQFIFALERVAAMAPQHPEWKTTQPFQSLIAGDKAAIANFTDKDVEAIMLVTHTGMTVDQFHGIVKDWLAQARDKRWNRPYTELIYQPMLELMQYLRANGYRTYIVTGGGQEFVRVYAEQVYGIPPEQVIGTALATQYTHDDAGQLVLMRTPKLLLNDNSSGKAEDIYLFTGRHSKAAFGNTAGDQQMLQYTQTAGGAPLMMLVLHDDAQREYAYGPAQGLPDSKVGTFTQALYDQAKAKGWIVISMKDDWKHIFAWEK
jgi:phosphoserine phosphatase